MIKTLNLPELTFDENKHIYKLNGAVIPSVTNIMQPLSQSYYGGIDEDILETAAKRGRTVHQSIENFLKFGIDDIPSEHEGYYKAFKTWWKDKSPTLIATESRVYHKVYRYAGTADLSCIVDGTDVCVDFKTSAQIVEMLARVQLEAYSKAYESHDARPAGKAIVHLQKDGEYKMVSYQSRDTEAWEIFIALLTVKNYLNKYGR